MSPHCLHKFLLPTGNNFYYLQERVFHLLQHHKHVETEKLEKPILKQIFQRPQSDIALLQPQIALIDQPSTSKSTSNTTLGKELKSLEKRLTAEFSENNSRPQSSKTHCNMMSDQIFQSEHCNSNFILWKLSSMNFGFNSAKKKYLRPGLAKTPTTQICSPIYWFHIHGCNSFNPYPYGFAAAIATCVSLSSSTSDADYNDVLPWPFWETNQLQIRDQLDPLSTWTQMIGSKGLTRPTSTNFSTVLSVRCPYSFTQRKLFNETDGYSFDNTMYIKNSSSDPPVLTLTQ